MKRVLKVTLLAVLLATTFHSETSAQEKFGIILMHGKQSPPTDNRSGLPTIASTLQGHGHKVIMPAMPWSQGGWEKISVTVEQVFDMLDGYAAQLRSQGAQRIVIIGHSLGANIGLSYAANRGNVAGLVMAAPGHSPGFVYRSDSGKKSIDRAAELMRSGHGADSYSGIDNNQGTSFTIGTTVAVYLSWLNPRGLASMDAQAPKLPASTALLMVVGEKDPVFGRAKAALYDPAAKNPYSKYVTVGADHVQTPFAASKQIVDWIDGLPK
ncbi:MAG: alpha/beta hydrolase [Proteobacteria bacterium]|nr:alpha/beta hydrolase [Pseudomonadota bacterium]